jgi:antitoxin (DNA-binding transcriptional repressor) of toxin-antitoxin stability system
MTVVNIYDAKTRLSKLIEEAAAGNDVAIARGGKPVARLTRLGSAPCWLEPFWNPYGS